MGKEHAEGYRFCHEPNPLAKTSLALGPTSNLKALLMPARSQQQVGPHPEVSYDVT